ncbi:MAG: hypothetical protein R2754_03750 [Microthrixaceae bacterium]
MNRVRAWHGAPAEFHAGELPTPSPGDIDVWLVRPDRPTVVAGSTQRGVIDEALAADAGLAVTRRRTGGGVVVVEPVGTVWLDVVLARGDHRVSDDVGRSFDWVGATLGAGLRSAGVAASVHEGPGEWDELGRLVCFAGVGPGEALDATGRKVLGLSQRRTRSQVRFQVVAYSEVPVAATLAGLPDAALPGGRSEAAHELTRRTAGLGDARPAAWWADRLAAALAGSNSSPVTGYGCVDV